MWRALLTTLAVAAACWASSAFAENADMEIGVLTCTLAEAGDALASDAPSQERTRDALCVFRAKMGAEESYFGRVQGVTISADHIGTLMWLVRSASGAATDPGALQKIFAPDSNKPADQKPPLIGAGNLYITLHSMSDRTEGNASATEKQAPTGFVILSLELKLKSASG